jgi:hypothetical protein
MDYADLARRAGQGRGKGLRRTHTLLPARRVRLGVGTDRRFPASRGRRASYPGRAARASLPSSATLPPVLAAYLPVPVVAVHRQFERQEFCTCDGQLHCPRLFAATQKPEIKAAPEHHSTERTCQVIAPLSPIEAAARDAVTRRFQRVDFDAELIGKPLCARRGDREPLSFTRNKQHPFLQCRGEQHSQFTGEMVVAGAGESERIVFLALRFRPWREPRIVQSCESFQHGCDVFVGEPVIPMSAFSDHGQKTPG